MGLDQNMGTSTGGSGCDNSVLASTLHAFIQKCAGLVDAASVLVIESCRGESDVDQNRTKRRDEGIVEFSADDAIDDVSALSANTLEEMEPIAKLVAGRTNRNLKGFDGNSGPYPGQQLTAATLPCSKGGGARLSVERSPSNTDLSIGVATSGSSSAHVEQFITEKNPARQNGKREFERFTAQVETSHRR